MQNHTERSITLVPSSICFRLPSLETDAFSLKVIFNHQNSNINGLFSQNDINKTLRIIFHDLELKLTLQMTLNHQNNTLQSTTHEKDILHIFLALFVKKYIFPYLILKLTF